MVGLLQVSLGNRNTRTTSNIPHTDNNIYGQPEAFLY